MKKVNLLSRAEMRKVLGGQAPISGCKASCDCGKPYATNAEIINCTGTCSAKDNDKASCDNPSTTVTCAEVCQAVA